MTEPTRPLRVLQVLGSSAGGVARHVAQVAQGARDRGVDVVVAGPGALRDQLTGPDGTPFRDVEITDRPGPGDVVALGRLRRLGAGADVVHAHGLRAGALAVLAARSTPHRPAVVVTLHNLPVGGRAVLAVAGALEGLVDRGADVVLGVSGDLVQRARERGATVTDRALVPAPARPAPTVLRAEVRARLGVAEGRPLLLTVSRLAPQKGLDLLCDTAALLAADAATGPPVDEPPLWVVAGDGPLRAELDRRIADEGLPVRPLGRREDVADLLAAADVVVSTARWEGQPLGIQEALAQGAAVVATDVGGTAEVTGDAAVLVPTDAGALADAIRSLLRDAGGRRALGERARTRAGELPDLDDVLDQLVVTWTAAADRRRRAVRASTIR